MAASRLLLYHGTTLAGIVVALVGANQDRRWLVGVGAGLLALISIPLVGGLLFVFPLLSAMLYLVAILVSRHPPRRPTPASP